MSYVAVRQRLICDIFSLLLCAKSSFTMWNNLQKVCQSNQFQTHPAHFRTHSQSTSKCIPYCHMQEKHSFLGEIKLPWLQRNPNDLYQSDRERKKYSIGLAETFSKQCLLYTRPCWSAAPTCHFSWGLTSEVKVPDISMGGQCFCDQTWPSLLTPSCLISFFCYANLLVFLLLKVAL